MSATRTHPSNCVVRNMAGKVGKNTERGGKGWEWFKRQAEEVSGGRQGWVGEGGMWQAGKSLPPNARWEGVLQKGMGRQLQSTGKKVGRMGTHRQRWEVWAIASKQSHPRVGYVGKGRNGAVAGRQVPVPVPSSGVRRGRRWGKKEGRGEGPCTVYKVQGKGGGTTISNVCGGVGARGKWESKKEGNCSRKGMRGGSPNSE